MTFVLGIADGVGQRGGQSEETPQSEVTEGPSHHQYSAGAEAERGEEVPAAPPVSQPGGQEERRDAGILEVFRFLFYHFSYKVQSAPLAVGRLTRRKFIDKEGKGEGEGKQMKGKKSKKSNK